MKKILEIIEQSVLIVLSLFAKIIHNKLQEASKHIINKDHNSFSPGQGWPIYSPVHNKKGNSKGRGNACNLY